MQKPQQIAIFNYVIKLLDLYKIVDKMRDRERELASRITRRGAW